jgi:cellulose synthase/poly-beta-1,6-N-acetylglucosamine synthase-like glycosyltransferase
MMNWLLTILFLFQLIIGFYFLFPFLLYLSVSGRKERINLPEGDIQPDYAIIVTAYEQTVLIPSVVDSILKLNYQNYLIYVVADNCDISNLIFEDERVVVLRPEQVLSNNIKSHFYAIEHFKRPHERLTIIDSDNLVHPEYLKELNTFFNKGYLAVQGVRRAKNLNSHYACLDEAGDIYYRYVDRKLLFGAGSSASLAGSGMAFTTNLYRECLEHIEISGAGFDKLLQYEIIKRGHRIAFSENAIVFDEKTAKSDQLVKQRARWINSWFKYVVLGLKLGGNGLKNFCWNQILFSVMLLRPPLFMLFLSFGLCFLVTLFFQPILYIGLWFGLFILFIFVFYRALKYFQADPLIYTSLMSYPKFFYLQLLALGKAKKANKLSVATKHEHESSIQDLNK